MTSRGTSSYYAASDIEDDISDAEIILMTLRKPTELKKVIESVPKPLRAVPKNSLPKWYKLGLECKLPVPKKCDKIIFSRGRLGEDFRRVGLGADVPSPSFDLTDPNCYNVSYDYQSLHDSHLAHHFQQKPARNRMKVLGFCTSDNRAVCSLKEFNQYRKYLYNRFMDRIHSEMKKLDERARDDLALKRVEVDVARRSIAFTRQEKAREHLERYAQLYADEIAEKKRLAKEQEKIIRARMKYLEEFKEKQRKERVIKSQERENIIKQRITTAAELELKRKITMVRTWRANEKRRLARMKQLQQAKERRIAEQADRQWDRRVQDQNRKLQEEAMLLKRYTEDLAAGALRRMKAARIYAYNNDLNLQKLKLANMKKLKGGEVKYAKLVKKMGIQFERSKRGAKGMSPELANVMAQEAMANANSTKGDVYMTLGQARIQMDTETVLPVPPLKILEQMIETVVVEFARRRVNLLLKNVEDAVQNKFLAIIFNRQPASKRRKQPRKSIQVTSAISKHYSETRGTSIAFASGIERFQRDEVEDELDVLKSVKTRTPTPVPSLTKLAEVTFIDRIEDLPDPAVNTFLPERRKLLEMVNTATKILSRTVSHRVDKGIDITLGKVIMPHLRRKMEWGEAVECLADVVVNNRVNSECSDVRRVGEYLSFRILQRLKQEMKDEKMRQKAVLGSMKLPSITEDNPQQDFYVPGQTNDTVAGTEGADSKVPPPV